MTATDTAVADVVPIYARLDPFTDALPPGADVADQHAGPPVVTVTLDRRIADALNDLTEGTADVWDHTSRTWWTLSVAPRVGVGRPPTDREPARQFAFVALPALDQPPAPDETPAEPMIGLPAAEEAADTPEPESESWPEITPGAYGTISGTVWNGSHEPIPAGTATYDSRIVLDLDRDQFEMLWTDVLLHDEEHRGIIDRRTGYRWTVTHLASWHHSGDPAAPRYRLAPEPAMAAADTHPEAPTEAEPTYDRIIGWTTTDPRGLGAVVADDLGRLFVRHCPGDCPDRSACIPWHNVGWGTNHTWDAVTAGSPVLVHSRGVFGLSMDASNRHRPPREPETVSEAPPEAPGDLSRAASSLSDAAEALIAAAKHLQSRR